jgi:hypothetical protein
MNFLHYWCVARVSELKFKIQVKRFLTGFFLGFFSVLLVFTSFRGFQSYFHRDFQATLVFAVTPTRARLTQRAELTRISNLVSSIPNIYWIVIEEGKSITSAVKEILQHTKATKTVHLAAHAPKELFTSNTKKSFQLGTVAQYNSALNFISKYNKNGVVIFLHEEHAYEFRLFSLIRDVESILIWPVKFIDPKYEQTVAIIIIL